MSAPDSWTNFDTSPTLRTQRIPVLGAMVPGPKFPRNVRYGDIVLGLPLAEASCDAIYCSHVLEHLSLNDCRAAIRNTYKVLKPGRVFRLVLPDILAMVEEYRSSNDPRAALTFIENTGMSYPDRPRGMMGALRSWIGNSKHLWMWDYNSLSAELADGGFKDIRRAQYGDSGDEMFKAVENEGRWGPGSLGLQCCRPN
jgi:SAM-dependent methyltransferase